MVMMMVKAAGISTPPVKPWKARSTIICSRFCAKAQATEKARNRAALTSRILAHREDARQPAGQRDDDDLGDQVGGGDPAAVVDAGADRALDVGQGGVDDLDVEDGHERAEGRADHGEPGRERDRSVGILVGRGPQTGGADQLLRDGGNGRRRVRRSDMARLAGLVDQRMATLSAPVAGACPPRRRCGCRSPARPTCRRADGRRARRWLDRRSSPGCAGRSW